MRRVALATLVLLSTTGIAACGGGSDRLSREEFIAQANAICRAGNERLDAAAEEVFPAEGEPEPDALEEFFEGSIEDIRGQVDDVAELEPPEELEDDVDAFLDEARSALEEVDEAGAEAAFSQDADPFDETTRLADELGLTECAED